jgi:opacity protein-like surface antigen
MANIYYDVPLGKSRVRPYGGGGIGFYQSQLNGLLPQFFSTLGIPTEAINATSNAPFAYQFRGGLDYELSRRVVFFTGYRFFHGDVLTFSAVPFGTFHPNGANMHSIEAGFRFGLH